MATVADLKEQLAKAEKQLAAAKEPDEVNFATKKINRIKGELSALEKAGKDTPKAEEKPAAKKEAPAAKPVEKKAPAPAKAEKPKPAAAVKKKPTTKAKYADLPSCDELQTAFLKRREQREKSQKKYKTKSAINKAANNLATATKQVAAAIEMPESKKEANSVISKLEKLKKNLMETIDLLEELSNDETTKKEVQAILGPLDEKLKKIRSENK